MDGSIDSPRFSRHLSSTKNNPAADMEFPVHKIVNSQLVRDHHNQMSAVKKQQKLFAGESSHDEVFIFTRQIYNPELIFNQDPNRQDVQIDYNSANTWHVNRQKDSCYICNQWRYCLMFFSHK